MLILESVIVEFTQNRYLSESEIEQQCHHSIFIQHCELLSTGHLTTQPVVKWKQVTLDGWQVVSMPVKCGFVGPDLNGLTNFSVTVVVLLHNDLDVGWSGDRWTVTHNAEWRCRNGIASYVAALSPTQKGIYFEV